MKISNQIINFLAIIVPVLFLVTSCDTGMKLEGEAEKEDQQPEQTAFEAGDASGETTTVDLLSCETPAGICPQYEALRGRIPGDAKFALALSPNPIFTSAKTLDFTEARQIIEQVETGLNAHLNNAGIGVKDIKRIVVGALGDTFSAEGPPPMFLIAQFKDSEVRPSIATERVATEITGKDSFTVTYRGERRTWNIFCEYDENFMNCGTSEETLDYLIAVSNGEQPALDRATILLDCAQFSLFSKLSLLRQFIEVIKAKDEDEREEKTTEVYQEEKRTVLGDRESTTTPGDGFYMDDSSLGDCEDERNFGDSMEAFTQMIVTQFPGLILKFSLYTEEGKVRFRFAILADPKREVFEFSLGLSDSLFFSEFIPKMVTFIKEREAEEKAQEQQREECQRQEEFLQQEEFQPQEFELMQPAHIETLPLDTPDPDLLLDEPAQ